MDFSKLEKLFDSLCDDFQKLLDAETPMTAADRKLLIEFLKDNEVTCIGHNNQSVVSIIDKLPFSEEDSKLAINQ